MPSQSCDLASRILVVAVSAALTAHCRSPSSISALAQERRVTTHVEVIREGDDSADLFYSLLIDDPDELADTPIPPVDQQMAQAPSGQGRATASPSPGPSPTGVEQFVEHIKAEVFSQLQPHQ